MILYGVLRVSNEIEGKYGKARLPNGMYYIPVYALKDEAIKAAEEGKFQIFTIEGEKKDD